MIRWYLMLAAVLFMTVVAAKADDIPFVASLGSDGVQRAALVGGDYYFRPSHIVVKVNRPVELSVRKEGWLVPHDFVIDAPDAGIRVHQELSSDPVSITFTPTRTGAYPFYCDKKLIFMKSHREQGMSGFLEVVE